MADIVFVDPAASPGQLAIEILETIVVGDALDLLPGIFLSIDETIVVDDDVVLLPGVLLQIQETIAVNDGLEVEVALHNTLIGVNVLVRLRDELTGLDRVQVLFPLVTRSGLTAFTTRMDGPAPPPGFVAGDPPIVYDVTTTAGFEGMVTVCLDLTAQRFTGPTPRIFHFEGTSWVDRTVSIDEAAQLVCGSVHTLSPFALFQATDRTAPVTTIAASPGPNAAGWNRTDVALAFTAADPPDGTGIKRVQVSLSGAHTGTVTDISEPIVLSAEGTTTVTYFRRRQRRQRRSRRRRWSSASIARPPSSHSAIRSRPRTTMAGTARTSRCSSPHLTQAQDCPAPCRRASCYPARAVP